MTTPFNPFDIIPGVQYKLVTSTEEVLIVTFTEENDHYEEDGRMCGYVDYDNFECYDEDDTRWCCYMTHACCDIESKYADVFLQTKTRDGDMIHHHISKVYRDNKLIFEDK